MPETGRAGERDRHHRRDRVEPENMVVHQFDLFLQLNQSQGEMRRGIG